MNQWKVILATLVIFGAGVITGALAINLATGNRLEGIIRKSKRDRLPANRRNKGRV